MNYFLSRPRLVIALFFAAVMLAFFAPALFGRMIFLTDSDAVRFYYPMFMFYSDALHSGQSFLWVPGIFSGFPEYLSQSGGFVDPLNLLIFKVFSGIPGMQLRLAFDVLLTFVCSYAAARALGVSRLAAALTGPAYLLAFHWRFLSNPIIANTLFLLPLLIYCCTRAYNGTRVEWRYIALAAGGIGWALLGGYTQLVFYAVVLAGLYTLGLLFVYGSGIRQAGKVLGSFVLAAVLGGIISLPLILPTLKFLPLTTRANTASYHDATLKVIEPGDLALFAVPDYFYVPYLTAGRKPLYTGPLWGLLAAGAAIYALVSLGRLGAGEQERRRMAVIALMFLFAFTAAFQWSPLYWLLNKLPVFSLFRFPFRFMFLGAFLFSLLGAYGFDRVRELASFKPFRFIVYAAATLTALFAGFLAFIQLVPASSLASALYAIFSSIFQGRFGFTKDLSHYREAIERGIAAYRELLSFADYTIAIPLALLLAAVVLPAAFIRGWISPERFRVMGAALSVFIIVSVGVIGWRLFAPNDSLFYHNPLTERVAADAAAYRSYSFMPDAAASQKIPPQYKLSPEEELAAGQLVVAGAAPNNNLPNRLPSVDGYDQFEPVATLDAISRIGGELLAGYGGGTQEERVSALTHHLGLLGMMGGKYVISGLPLPRSDLRLMGTTSVSAYGLVLYYYENPHALPIYYLASSITDAPGADFAALAARSDSAWEKTVYLDCAHCAQGSGVGMLTPVRIENGSYDFKVQGASSQYLVLSESFLPGWEAAIDGKIQPLMRANGLYMAVAVPAGEHAVTFTYTGVLHELSFWRALGIVH